MDATINTYREPYDQSQGFEAILGNTKLDSFFLIVPSLFCLYFVLLLLYSLYGAIKSSIQKRRELSRRKKLQHNPDLFCETGDSETNTPDPECQTQWWNPWNRTAAIETRRTVFLSYPNTGTCYQAPAAYPV